MDTSTPQIPHPTLLSSSIPSYFLWAKSLTAFTSERVLCPWNQWMGVEVLMAGWTYGRTTLVPWAMNCNQTIKTSGLDLTWANTKNSYARWGKDAEPWMLCRSPIQIELFTWIEHQLQWWIQTESRTHKDNWKHHQNWTCIDCSHVLAIYGPEKFAQYVRLLQCRLLYFGIMSKAVHKLTCDSYGELAMDGPAGGLPKDHIALFSEIKYFKITTRCGRTIAPIRRWERPFWITKFGDIGQNMFCYVANWSYKL